MGTAFAPGTGLWGAEGPLDVLCESRCHTLGSHSVWVLPVSFPLLGLSTAMLMHLVKPCPLPSAGELKMP